MELAGTHIKRVILAIYAGDYTEQMISDATGLTVKRIQDVLSEFIAITNNSQVNINPLD